ncbi:uncharacterized protein LOC132174420 [Corylus avellana]|uniref:uncharacterized protein LOC132174420 n=1 Tax=Corylus avellana TaxID=13451 RepID=UPI00286AD8CE|nr:uncharacterized protein LOC132174420 [Corylus avellana]
MWVIYVDSSSTKNKCGAGVVMITPDKKELKSSLRLEFKTTNNEAEYEAVIAELGLAREMETEFVEVRSDSQVIVDHSRGEFEAKGSKMKLYLSKVQDMKKAFKKFCIIKIPWEENEKADQLARLGLAIEDEMGETEQPIQILQQPSITEEVMVLTIEIILAWAEEIVGYLERGVLPGDKRKLSSISSPWPFSQWGVDIVGPLSPEKGGVRFAVVTVDYFTKWAEVEALVNIIAKNIEKFLWKNVICRYGIPHAFITDNGKQFDCDSFRDWCAGLHVRQYFSSPRHPQANGQVEATNKTIFKILKTKLDQHKGSWAEDLPEVL